MSKYHRNGNKARTRAVSEKQIDQVPNNYSSKRGMSSNTRYVNCSLRLSKINELETAWQTTLNSEQRPILTLWMSNTYYSILNTY